MPSDSPLVAHLRFVDGTLIFCNTNEERVKNVKSTLICFEVLSGLKTNFVQSEMIGIRVEDPLLHKYANLPG